MAIGTTGSVQADENGNPIESTRQTSSFQYTPVDPQEDAMRQIFQQSQQQQMADPVAQSKAASMAAMKFIAFRGYQQDLKNGQSAADAFAKWGPMLVQDTSFAPALKAMAPAPKYTFNSQTQAYEPSGGGAGSTGRPVFNPHPAVVAPAWVPANPTTGEPAHWTAGGKIDEPKAPSVPKVDPFSMSRYKEAEGEFKNALKMYGDPTQTEAVRVEAGQRMHSAQVRMRNIEKSAGGKLAPNANQQVEGPDNTPADEAAPEPAAAPSGIPKAGEVRKGYKFKGGNPALATNWQKVQ
jgi:hypothetical protein